MRISGKWIIVCLYTIGIFIVTPYLPNVIRFVSSWWSSAGASGFVLGMEIMLALLILALGIGFLIYKKKKSAIFFLISIGGILLLSFIIYQFIPNPYEFTHLPEYAILSMLVIRALDRMKGIGAGMGREKEKAIKPVIIRNSYFLSGLIIGVIGTGDEIYQHILPNRHFGLHDIFLNILGGILGLLVFWGTKR